MTLNTFSEKALKEVLLPQLRFDMKFDKNQLSGLEIEFDSGTIPPPFSHVFRLALDWASGSLHTKLVLHYTDRDELSEQEIIEEGFTPEDDYSGELQLNSVWIDPILDLLKNTRWNSKQLNDGGITLSLVENGKLQTAKVPANQEDWQLMAQDIIQAIYESTKKEKPLSIHFRKVDHDSTRDIQITVFFQDREVILKEGEENRVINWDYAIQLMKLIFTPDYDYELAKETPSNKRGEYIECGDGLWHELGKGVINIDPSFDTVSKIKSSFNHLLEG